jgi:hypothetical protein
MYRIVLQPSRTLAAILISGHAVFAGSIWICGLTLWLSILLTAVVGASLVHALRRHVWMLGDDAITELRLSATGVLGVRRSQGPVEPVDVDGNSYVSHFLIVLNLKGKDRRRKTVVIMRDSTESLLRRRLAVWLRWGAETDPA